MNYKNLIFIVIFLFITNCASNNLIKNKKNTLLLDNFSNTGFALIFDQKDYDNDLISHKIDDSLVGAIITPDKDIIPNSENLEPAFIVFENYEKILQWNRSLRFGLAVCTLKNKFENEL